jgi:predicted nucleotidyltransferase
MLRYRERCDARKRQLEGAAQEMATFCATKRDIVGVYVFGSLADGNIHPQSDLDLLIVRETTALPPHRADDIYREAPVMVGFDALVVTPNEYRNRLPLTPFGRTVLSQARPLYERR